MAGRSKYATIPADFQAHALTHTVAETRAHFAIGWPLFMRWADAVGIGELVRNRRAEMPQREMPTDFAEVAHLSNKELKARYQAGTKVLARWRAAAGATRHGGVTRIAPPEDFKRTVATMYIAQACRHYDRTEEVIKRWAAETGASFATWRGWRGPQKAPDADGRASDLAGQAQRHLQRIGPVFKRGDDYSVFGRTMPAGAMVEFAKGKGFDPDAWRRL